jgi:hypothetical protein
MRPELTRYWFEFDTTRSPNARHRPLVGVTAWSVADAEDIVREKVFDGGALPAVAKLIEDVDVTALDPNHVRNQMNPPNLRGVWYPLGYDR